MIDIPRNEMDLCTHRVVTTLKTNCNKLTLEEIGKLAVMLMNCQLEIEGRPIYPCRPEMVSVEFFINSFRFDLNLVLEPSTMHCGNGFEHVHGLQFYDPSRCRNLLSNQI